MFSLEDLLGQQGGNEALQQISNMLGADQNTTDSAIQIALPVILSGLANNASTPQGAQSLNNALEQDHNGGLLDMLGGFLGGGTAQSRQTDGGGILGHILGNKQGQVAQEISNKSGMDLGQVAKLLITLAPIVMAYLGKQKQKNDLDAGGISDLLTGQQQKMQSTGNPMIDLATRMLDKDGDGSALDDLASMAAGYFTNS
ncbi:MAG: DUF937 domain-containing protein [Acidobacteria bacterium]|nr:DUF937 domain-containing protein [Acidobacteriota bacterium]